MSHVENMQNNHQLWCIWDTEENSMVEALFDTEREAHRACDKIEIEEGYGDPEGFWARYQVAGYYHA